MLFNNWIILKGFPEQHRKSDAGESARQTLALVAAEARAAAAAVATFPSEISCSTLFFPVSPSLSLHTSRFSLFSSVSFSSKQNASSQPCLFPGYHPLTLMICVTPNNSSSECEPQKVTFLTLTVLSPSLPPPQSCWGNGPTWTCNLFNHEITRWAPCTEIKKNFPF